MKLSKYITDFMENITDSAFLVSGGGIMHVVDSLGRSKIECICCHHEQGAAKAAEGYARMKNDLGFCVVTTGPGATNTFTGVAAAWLDKVPVLFISGQVRTEVMVPEEKRSILRQVGPQELNVVDCVKPITKYAVTITDPTEIRYHLEKAIYLAKSGAPGPVSSRDPSPEWTRPSTLYKRDRDPDLRRSCVGDDMPPEDSAIRHLDP